MKKIVINATNLHSGGGVQVAISFIYELAIQAHKIDSQLFDSLTVAVSTEVSIGLGRLGVTGNEFSTYLVANSNGVKAIFSELNATFKDYDLIFTIFGPNYLRVKPGIDIVGFAQPWMLNFDNPISRDMPFISRNLLKLKFFVQWLFFLRSDHLVVELNHVKNSLVKKNGYDVNKISVVHNTVSSLYLESSKWTPVAVTKVAEEFSLGIVTRDYPHKNLKILPLVARLLETKHKMKFHFYTTLNDEEWATKDEDFKKYVSTVGSLTPDQCPSFYQQVDGVIFPSLLECFSATPLEAMVMTKPLFSSDRGFVRDVCGDYSLYFDPEDAADIAEKIANYFKSNIDYSERLTEARNHALNFSSARGRAEKYLEIIQQHIAD